MEGRRGKFKAYFGTELTGLTDGLDIRGQEVIRAPSLFFFFFLPEHLIGDDV